MSNRTEVWLRGPLQDIPFLLQPVAHALLQAEEEVNEMLADFPETKLWAKSFGAASVGFHLQHIAGVLDRLFTYAEGRMLSEEQLRTLAEEGIPSEAGIHALLEKLNKQVGKSLNHLSMADEQTLREHRSVGRAGLPSTVMGLFFHSAEHTMRHVGQLLVTVRVIKYSN